MSNRLLRRVAVARTDLVIPYATLGCMMFGSRADEAESRRIVDAAFEHGINFFDTADSYTNGESERILGRALKGKRANAIVATKVGYGKNEEGNEEGLSPAAISRAIDLSLKRLDTDYVDIYYLHRPDYTTPIEATLSAIQDLIRAGKIRYFGISNFGAWQTYEILCVCEANGWTPPVMTQMIYNALVRQIEYEYVRLCKAKNLHLTVYNPLAGGLLTGKYASLADEKAGGRFIDNPMYRNRYWSRRFLEGALGLKQIADAIGISVTHLAINWIAQRNQADSVLLGPSSVAQLLDCLAAGEVTLSEDDLKRIDAFLREFEGTDACYAR